MFFEKSKLSPKAWLARKAYKKTPNGRLIRYRESAKRRGLTFNITLQDYLNITSLSCTYCGETQHIGIDRVDNLIGYEISNCAPCCAICNKLKSNYSKEFFLEKITSIFNHLNK